MDKHNQEQDHTVSNTMRVVAGLLIGGLGAFQWILRQAATRARWRPGSAFLIGFP